MPKITTKRIKVTDECNQNCIFCSGASVSTINRRFYSKRYITKQISQRNGAMRLNITGGEPTLCKDLKEFVKLAKDVGYKEIALLTNGNNFANKKYTSQIKKSGLTEAIVSIHHFEPRISDKISNVKGSFFKKINGIKNLCDSRIKVTANIVILSVNSTIIQKLVHYLYSTFKIHSFAFSMLEPNCTKVNKNAWLVPDIKSSLFYLKKAINYCKKKEVSCYIPYDGAIPPCIFKKYNISTNKPEVIIGSDFDSSRIHLSFCNVCTEKICCRGFLRRYIAPCSDILFKN